MRQKLIFVLLLIGIIFSNTLAQLQISTSNPNYLTYNGETYFLICAQPLERDWHVNNWGGTNFNTAFIDKMVAHNCNHFWVMPDCYYDTNWNDFLNTPQAYWDSLEAICQAAYENDIIVGISMFGYGIQKYHSTYPWSKAKGGPLHVNDTFEFYNTTGQQDSIIQSRNGQKYFMDQVINATWHLPNVYYSVGWEMRVVWKDDSNTSTDPGQDDRVPVWTEWMINYMQTKGALIDASKSHLFALECSYPSKTEANALGVDFIIEEDGNASKIPEMPFVFWSQDGDWRGEDFWNDDGVVTSDNPEGYIEPRHNFEYARDQFVAGAAGIASVWQAGDWEFDYLKEIASWAASVDNWCDEPDQEITSSSIPAVNDTTIHGDHLTNPPQPTVVSSVLTTSFIDVAGGSCVDSTMVPAPSYFQATAVAYDSISLSWQDNPINEDGYVLSRSLDSTNFSVIDTLAENTDNYIDSGLDNNTPYYYQLYAYKSSMNSDTVQCSVTTLDSTALVVEILDVYTNHDYAVSYNDLSIDSLQYTDKDRYFTSTGGLEGCTYIQTYGNDKYEEGEAPDGYLFSISVNKPVIVYVARDSIMTNSPDWLSSYQLEEETIRNDIRTFKLYSKVFTETDSIAFYSNEPDQSTLRTMYSVIIKEYDPTQITAPSDFQAGNITDVSAELTWEDNSNNELGFIISRSLNGSNYTIVDTANAGVQSYVDYGLTDSTVYYYRLFSYNSVSQSDTVECNFTTLDEYDLVVNILDVYTNHDYAVSYNDLSIDSLQYTDKDRYFTSTGGLEGCTYIQTYGNDKYEEGEAPDGYLFSISVNKPVIVYVARDSIMTNSPDWLSSYQLEEETIRNDIRTFKLYSKVFTETDSIAFYSNEPDQSTLRTMYSVIIKEIGLSKKQISFETEKKPETFQISANYPNPFNPVTTIDIQVPESGDVTLSIFNIMGQKVKTLVDQQLQSGYYSFKWDATNQYGNQVSSGLYFYKVQYNDITKIQKMVLTR